MISNLTSTSPYVAIGNSYGQTVYGSGPAAGMVRYNTNTQNMEVFDGNVWIGITQQASVGLSWEASQAMEWAIKRKKEEEEIAKLAEESEAVRIALENVKQAEEKLKITAHLAKEPA